MRAIAWGAYALELRTGGSYSMLRTGRAPGERPFRPPSYTPEDVAELIASAPAPRLTGAAVRVALQRTVDGAMYWQEPHGEDVLAATEPVRAQLTRYAELVASMPELSWWSAPCAGRQHLIRWDDDRDGALATALPTPDAATWVADALADERRAARERPRDPAARYSGRWWSVPTTMPVTVGRLPGALGLVEDSFGWKHAVTTTADTVGRVYEVRTAQDWVGLCAGYPLEVTASRRHDWYRTTGTDSSWVIPDWARVASDWDAVHLTVDAYLATAGRALPVDGGAATVLAGWNPDSTIWLTGTPTPRPGSEHWDLDADAETWRPARRTHPV